MKRNPVLIESVITGIVIAVTILLVQGYFGSLKAPKPSGIHAVQLDLKQDLPGSQPAPPCTEKLTVSATHAHLPASIIVEVGRETLCLFVLIFNIEDRSDIDDPDIPLPLIKFFTTLFSTFISPNAP